MKHPIHRSWLRAAACWAIAFFVGSLSQAAENLSAGYGGRRDEKLTMSDADDPLKRVDKRLVRKLTVQQCLTLALGQNYDIAIEQITPRQNALDITTEKAAFDPRLTAKALWREDTRPTRSRVQYGEGGAVLTGKSNTRDMRLQAGVAKKIVTGAELGVSLVANRNNSTVSRTAINPYYSTDLTLSLTQPLLRNAWLPYNRSRIRIAYNTHKRSLWVFKNTVMKILYDVQKAYWELVRAIEEERVSRAALLRAKRLYEENKLRAKAGTLAPIEVLQAEAEVAAQRETVIVAQQNVRNAEDNLKQLLNLRGPDGRLSEERIEPATRPDFQEIELDRRECLREARLNRPEYFMSELDLKNERLRLMQNKNQLLPGLDLRGDLTWHGRGGSLDNAFDRLPGDWEGYPGHSQFYGFSLELSLDYPLGNRAAKSRYLRSRLDVQKRVLQHQQVDLQVQTEVRQAVRAVLTNIERVKANRVATYLARERLKAEEKKLSVGKSTSFDVLQAQEDLAVREREEVRAIVDYRTSLVALERAKGTLLKACDVFVAE